MKGEIVRRPATEDEFLTLIKRGQFNIRCLGDLMSNLYHEVDVEVAEELKNDTSAYAAYPARNFLGFVIYHAGEFHCMVMQYHQFREVVSRSTPKEIMDYCCKKWGYD